LPGLDKEVRRAIRPLEHLDNLSGNLSQRSIVDNNLRQLDRHRLGSRLRDMVWGIFLLR
jgi:hypothetical protein